MRFLISLLTFFFPPIMSSVIWLSSNCEFPVWVAYLGRNGVQTVDTFPLIKKELKEVTLLDEYSVKFWAKTTCNEFREYCETGDCGPFGCVPATLVEIALGVNGHLNLYDVNVAEGFNVPISVAPFNKTSTEGHICGMAKCITNLNEICPEDLKEVNDSGETIACLNACARFHTDEYCCGDFNSTQATCTSSEFSEFFHEACPDAYSYAYDAEATFYCSSEDPVDIFEVVFCP